MNFLHKIYTFYIYSVGLPPQHQSSGSQCRFQEKLLGWIIWEAIGSSPVMTDQS